MSSPKLACTGFFIEVAALTAIGGVSVDGVAGLWKHWEFSCGGRIAAPRLVAMAGPMLNVRLLLTVSVGGASDLPVSQEGLSWAPGMTLWRPQLGPGMDIQAETQQPERD